MYTFGGIMVLLIIAVKAGGPSVRIWWNEHFNKK